MSHLPANRLMERRERGSRSEPKRKKATRSSGLFRIWLRELDLNQRPSGYEPDELPDCSIPRLWGGILQPRRLLSTILCEKLILPQSLRQK